MVRRVHRGVVLRPSEKTAVLLGKDADEQWQEKDVLMEKVEYGVQPFVRRIPVAGRDNPLLQYQVEVAVELSPGRMDCRRQAVILHQ